MLGDIGGKSGMNDDAPGGQDSDKDHDEDDAPAAKHKPIGAKSTAKKVKDTGKPKPKPKPKAAAKPAAAPKVQLRIRESANVEEPTDQVEEPTDNAHRPKRARKTKTRAEPLSPISKEAKEAAKKKEANKRHKKRLATAKTVRMGQRLFERLDQGHSRAPRVPLPPRLVASPSFTDLDRRDVGNTSDLLHYALEILGPANAKPSVDDRGIVDGLEWARPGARIGSPPPRPRERETGRCALSFLGG
ncbi:hypothetical protein C8F04DRAFT_1260579 [Mycena alexandri]|uniref:Uncharacterized protein n=1 Tax=Mycena alexandri TaxID=1745969 RepID=A0AAD6X3T6_9AGAR|nr:hypothetical protein C8F04DRAFT_1260579 [Mycena alexandri]